MKLSKKLKKFDKIVFLLALLVLLFIFFNFRLKYIIIIDNYPLKQKQLVKKELMNKFVGDSIFSVKQLINKQIKENFGIRPKSISISLPNTIFLEIGNKESLTKKIIIKKMSQIFGEKLYINKYDEIAKNLVKLILSNGITIVINLDLIDKLNLYFKKMLLITDNNISNAKLKYINLCYNDGFAFK